MLILFRLIRIRTPTLRCRFNLTTHNLLIVRMSHLRFQTIVHQTATQIIPPLLCRSQLLRQSPPLLQSHQLPSSQRPLLLSRCQIVQLAWPTTRKNNSSSSFRCDTSNTRRNYLPTSPNSMLGTRSKRNTMPRKRNGTNSRLPKRSKSPKWWTRSSTWINRWRSKRKMMMLCMHFKKSLAITLLLLKHMFSPQQQEQQ